MLASVEVVPWRAPSSCVLDARGAGVDEIQEADKQTIDVEVWDFKAAKSFRGEAQVNLKDILDHGQIKETFKFALPMLALFRGTIACMPISASTLHLCMSQHHPFVPLRLR